MNLEVEISEELKKYLDLSHFLGPETGQGLTRVIKTREKESMKGKGQSRPMSREMNLGLNLTSG